MIKHIKWMSVVFLAALVAAPAFAQQTGKDSTLADLLKSQNSQTKVMQAKVNKAIEKATLEAAKKQQPKLRYCIYCGKEITESHQHCSAQNYTGLCSTKERTNESKKDNPAAPRYCAICGEKLTIDERFHGAKHECKEEEKEARYCIFCGEEIKTEQQKCAVTQGVCSTHCPDCGLDLRDSTNLSPDGVHHCKFKGHIEPSPIKEIKPSPIKK